MLAYSGMMFELLTTRNQSFYDQGVHNYIVHNRLVPNIVVHDNYNSTVYTAGLEPVEHWRWNEHNEILRDDGLPYPVLHQHDRPPDCVRRIRLALNEKKAGLAPPVGLLGATRER